MILFWDDRVAAWVAGRIPGCERGFGNCRALGVVSRNEMIAGIVFHNWDPKAGVIEISGAATSPRWFCRRVINVALGYVFDGLNCQMLITRQAPGNDRARGIWLALGGTEYLIPRLRGRDEAECFITLTEEAWRSSKFYQESGHGRKEQSAKAD